MTAPISCDQRTRLEQCWRYGLSWDAAATSAHVSLGTVQRVFAEFRAMTIPRGDREYSGSTPSPIEIPDEVLADRDRRGQLMPRDLVGWLAGDPLPGYSALERR